MKEIRLHGRGGQGVVKASQIIVSAAVAGGKQGQFIPFFGVERKGSPVFGYLRLSDKEIRRKTQIYEPDMLVIMDDSLIGLESTYDGLKEGGMIIINSVKTPQELNIPPQAGDVAIVDATGISEKYFERNIPNTAMLGAFLKATGLVDEELLYKAIDEAFGGRNVEAAKEAFDSAVIIPKDAR
jgi:2-oxoacid:acceptor oxidoreductase gamma subunit (pyruvate/2-ketoisovalerate family)